MADRWLLALLDSEFREGILGQLPLKDRATTAPSRVFTFLLFGHFGFPLSVFDSHSDLIVFIFLRKCDALTDFDHQLVIFFIQESKLFSPLLYFGVSCLHRLLRLVVLLSVDVHKHLALPV